METISKKAIVGIAVLYLIVGALIGSQGAWTYLRARGFIVPRSEVPIVVTYVFPTPNPISTNIPASPEPDQERIESPPSVEPHDPEPDYVAPFGELDLSDGTTTSFIVHTDADQGSYATGEFLPWSYREGIFESDLFDPDAGGAVSWLDNQDRIVLWVHSGPYHTVTALQRFIELDERGRIDSVEFAEERIRQHVVGATVQFNQVPDILELAHITAWARIPPETVDEINQHVIDLPEVLRELYPDQGWEGFHRDTMIVFFCGRQLVGDESDSSRPYWQQTRYVLGLLPLNNQGGSEWIASVH